MRHGYYTVGGTVYANKIDALHAATRSGQRVHWHWHKSYDHVPWSSDSQFSLREVYKQRALQLRENYDWVIVSFSGGSDSWTVLNSFLSNGIHIDEIFCRWPIKATENLYTPNKVDKRPQNILSEWQFAVEPVLKYIQKNYPKIKITIHDWSEYLLTTEITDDFWSETQDHLNPGFGLKYNAIGHSEIKSIDLGKKTCIVFGIDKPKICVKQGKVYCYFVDIIANCRAADRPGRSVELFYWTEDMPAVTHVQAREIYHYLCQNPVAAKLIEWGIAQTPETKHIWDNLVRNIVYPDYDLSTFQAKKATSSVLSECDFWMDLVPEKRFMQSWKNAFDNLVASVDSKFFMIRNGVHIGFDGLISPLYYLGDLPAEPLQTQRLT